MSSDPEQVRQDERIAALEHAMFGVGGQGGGMVAEMKLLREEIHATRQEFSAGLTAAREDLKSLYKTIAVSAVGVIGTIFGGLVLFVINSGGIQ